MDQDLFEGLVRRVTATQGFELVFGENRQGLSLLYHLSFKRQTVIVAERDMLALNAAILVSDWAGRLGLTIPVTGLSTATSEELSALAPHVLGVKYPEKHAAEKLTNVRFDIREKAAREILEAILTNEFEKELSEGGYVAVGSLEHRLTHCLEFIVANHRRTHSFKVTLDGWSGMLALGETFLPGTCYQEPTMVQDLIRCHLRTEPRKVSCPPKAFALA